ACCLPTTISTTDTHTLSLHDALPILISTPHTKVGQKAGCYLRRTQVNLLVLDGFRHGGTRDRTGEEESLLYRRGRDVAALQKDADRKSTRLNSSHVKISYAVFCLKKK